jgi:predicted nucleic acid-binding protein
MAERANGILLDTSVVVAHLRGSVDLQTLASLDEPVFLPLIALGELYRGVLKSARPDSNRAKVDEFLQIAAVLYPDVATAEIYAQIAQALDAKGTPIPEMTSGLRPWHWNAICRWLRVTTISDKSKRSISFGGEAGIQVLRS